VGQEKGGGSLLNIDLHTPFQQFYVQQKFSSQINISQRLDASANIFLTLSKHWLPTRTPPEFLW
jgi:hypothetical protein